MIFDFVSSYLSILLDSTAIAHLAHPPEIGHHSAQTTVLPESGGQTMAGDRNRWTLLVGIVVAGLLPRARER